MNRIRKLLNRKLLLISAVTIFIGIIGSQVFAASKVQALGIKDLENVTLSPEAKPILGRSEWHFKTSDGTFLGILTIEDGRTIYSNGTSSNHPSPLIITYYGPDAVEAGSSLEITFDGGETADIYLPALLTTTTLQVGVDGSTYYDADQTILAQEESSEEKKGKGEGKKFQCYSDPKGYGDGQHIGLNGSVDFGFKHVKEEIPIVFQITDGGMHAEPFDVSISGLNEKLLYTRKRACYKPKENSDCGEYTISYTYFAPAVNEGAKITVTDEGTDHKLDKDQQGADIYFTAHPAGVEITWPDPDTFTFVSEDPPGTPVQIKAYATTGYLEKDNEIIWRVVDSPKDSIDSGDPVPEETKAGRKITFTLGADDVPPPSPDGREDPLAYLITAKVEAYGYIFHAKPVTITQDKKDQLRQQYIDLVYDHFTMPTRDELSLTGPAEFIDATSPAYWDAGIEATVSNIESSYSHTFTIVSDGGSGFRCPIHNEEVSTWTPKKNSHHAYGRAADCHFKDENGNGSYTDEWIDEIKPILDGMTGIWYKEERVEDDPVYSTGWFHLQIPD